MVEFSYISASQQPLFYSSPVLKTPLKFWISQLTLSILLAFLLHFLPSIPYLLTTAGFWPSRHRYQTCLLGKKDALVVATQHFW